jgi:hemoglobin
MKKDIENMVDIRFLVDTFYGRIREDNLLAPIFDHQIGDRWPEHLEKMYRFWQTVLLDEHTYYGSPFPPHAGLQVEREHFVRWLSVFCNTVDNAFEGEKATKAKEQGERMAAMFHSKITYYKTGKSALL